MTTVSTFSCTVGTIRTTLSLSGGQYRDPIPGKNASELARPTHNYRTKRKKTENRHETKLKIL